jgi:hypothetical protein
MRVIGKIVNSKVMENSSTRTPYISIYSIIQISTKFSNLIVMMVIGNTMKVI